MCDLNAKVALVSGAGQGIGARTRIERTGA